MRPQVRSAPFHTQQTGPLLCGEKGPASFASNSQTQVLYRGRSLPNWNDVSMTRRLESSTALTTNPGAAGVPNRISKTSTSLPFSGDGTGEILHNGYCEKRRNSWKIGRAHV